MIDSYNILLIGSVFRTDCSQELMTAWEMVSISVVRMISFTSNQWKSWHNVFHLLDGFNHFVVILGKFIYMWLSLQIHTHSETISTRVQFCSLERNSRVISQMRKWGQECETSTRCYICENNMARHNMKQLHFLLLLLKNDFIPILACDKSTLFLCLIQWKCSFKFTTKDKYIRTFPKIHLHLRFCHTPSQS